MIHTTIMVERRHAPRELAVTVKAQMHSIGASVSDSGNMNYIASWDGVSPWLVVTKGTIASLTMAYAGWPMVDKATWDALHPVVPL